jgi:hypothetical protein
MTVTVTDPLPVPQFALPCHAFVLTRVFTYKAQLLLADTPPPMAVAPNGQEIVIPGRPEEPDVPDALVIVRGVPGVPGDPGTPCEPCGPWDPASPCGP